MPQPNNDADLREKAREFDVPEIPFPPHLRRLADDAELREQIATLKIKQSDEMTRKFGQFTFGDFLHPEQIDQIVQLFTSHNKKLERTARLDERKQVALDNYRGQTFSEATNYKGKFDKFIRNNERRIAQLSNLEGEKK